MKKTYTTMKTLVVLLSLLAFNLSAQISGVVTVDNSSATGGSNYQTFGALASALNTSGINGTLQVNVLTGTNSGVYNEQVQFNQITGMSATNTITINGNNCLLQFACSSGAPYIMQLNGTDYLTVSNLRMQSTSTSYGLICMLISQSDYNTFSGCTFSCQPNVTSSGNCPWSISASTTGLSAGSALASFNTVKSCTLFSGYYSIYNYGSSSAPYSRNNSFIDSRITDWYYYCMYSYYQKNMTVRNCGFDRDTRTSFTTTYCFYYYATQGLMFERNVIRDLYNMNQSYTGTLYMFYYPGYPSPDWTNRCTIRNNIVRDIKFGGTCYGIMYMYGGNCDVYHNTFSFDNPTSTNMGLYLFYYCYTTSGYGPGSYIKNNLYSVTLAGSGTKFIYYSPSSPMGANSYIDKNDFNLTSTNSYIGYINSNVATLAAWQTQVSSDLGSYALAPAFVNLAAGDLHPTNVLMNDLGATVNVPVDQQNMPRNQTGPDIGALEFLSNNCSSTPGSNSVFTPTAPICPGTAADLMLTTWNSDIGITYQWLTSTTSSVGPWTPIPGETSVLYTTPNLNTQTYFGVQITCTNAVGSMTAAGTISIAATSVSSVPYYESFEGISRANELPNCSWFVPGGLGGSAYTYTSSSQQNRFPRTGTKFASFYYLPAGEKFFYTNGIQLNAGITYSAAVWYTTEYYGYNNWSDLSILYGPSQTTVGLISIASTGGPAISNIYKLLSNTFTVATSGLYYVTVKTTNVSGSAQYLTWDDLSITIPCSLNAPNMALNASPSATVCSGEPLTLTATGADSFTWIAGQNAGSTMPSVIEYPFAPGVYGVIGTNTLTNCTLTQTVSVMVNQSPNVLVYASSPTVCAGQPVNLTAFGAINYNWNPVSSTSPFITDSPNTTTSYSVVGMNANGCSGTAVQVVTVMPTPTVNINTLAPPTVCPEDVYAYNATGGTSYQWVSSSTGNIMQGTSINVQLPTTTVFTVTGTDAFGCSNKNTYTQNVAECTGLKNNGGFNGLSVYPNPTSGEFVIELNNASVKVVTVTDLTGRIVLSSTSNTDKVNVNMNVLANGVYYVKIQSNNTSEVVKVVKQ